VLLRAAARAGDAIAPLVRAPLTTAVLDRLAGSLVLDTSHLAAVTGFRPPFTAEQGIAATAGWYLDRAAA
jgi:nucleoside-diphosphate-sugar epimerase